MTTPFQRALFQAALGNIDGEQLEAINTVQQSGKLGPDCPVADTDGNPLDKNAVYRYRGELIKITEWRFGGGNLMDCYYWVWFLRSSDMQTDRVTIEARYTKTGRVYESRFEKLK